MKELLKKINQARALIKGFDLKKLGRNTHSNYDYYTPEQISCLVNDACFDINLLNTYELIRTEHGLVAQITVWDLDTDESMKFSMATEIPSITATNIAQQLGGAVTYSERYLLMSIYDIKDNNLDFDAHKNNDKNSDKPKSNFSIRTIKPSELDNWNGKIYSGNTIYLNKEKIQLSKEQYETLIKDPKYKPNEKQ